MYTPKNKNKLISALLVGVFLLQPLALSAQVANGKDPEVQDLAQQLKTQHDAVAELQKKVDAYDKQIRAKRNEALTIKNQLDSLSDEIDQTKLKLELKKQEMAEVNLQVAQTEERIKSKDTEITNQKEKISEFIRLLHQRGQKTPIEILLTNNAFSEFFDQAQYMETVEGDLAIILQKLNAVYEKLQSEKKSLADQQTDLKNLQAQLQGTQVTLEGKVTAKNVILEATQADETKFQALLAQVRSEQAQINNDIVGLERQLRAKLAASGDTTLSELSGQGFVWPISSRRVTAYFHDPDYPFRRYFEHPAIDIATPQGTPLRAVASGYVSRTRDGGMGYSYISLIHADGLSSVYGHVSCITVAEDEYVVQGQVVGCSGATPGTPGAGNLTTGPHLHLEVRLNGIPVNPLDYLP